MSLAPTKRSRRKSKKHTDAVRDILYGHSAEAAKCLCDMLENDALSGTARAGVAKEILERTVGKGLLSDPSDEHEEQTFQLVLKVVE